MKSNRRQFLQMAGAGAVGLAIPGLAAAVERGPDTLGKVDVACLVRQDPYSQKCIVRSRAIKKSGGAVHYAMEGDYRGSLEATRRIMSKILEVDPNDINLIELNATEFQDFFA